MKELPLDKNNNNINGWNQALVDELKSMGCIQTPPVEATFQAVSRHQFLPDTRVEEVYSNKVILTKQDQNGQWISSSSQPAIMAIMLEQLGLEPGQKVLEIGAGTGYNAALMAHIVGETGQVVTVDIDEDVVEAAQAHLRGAGFDQVQVVCADGGYGYQDAAPFDRIILTVGASEIAPAWWEQLKAGGRLVLPLLLTGAMKSVAFVKGSDHFSSISLKHCGFMPLRGDFAMMRPKEIQIGPDANLYIQSEDELSIDRDTVYDLLVGNSKDWAVGIEVTGGEVLDGSLWTWLAFREPQVRKLFAKGNIVEQNIVPPLIGFDGKERIAGTVVLLDQAGLVALMRPPDQPLPLLPMDNPAAYDLPFALFIRQFGPNDLVTQRLIAEIQAWNAAGRPAIEKIRAYPRNSQYRPSKNEAMIERQWTKLILEWQAFAEQARS
jgi:protein-L-isoaspartate(D-aspartate) O-methyltransferase